VGAEGRHELPSNRHFRPRPRRARRSARRLVATINPKSLSADSLAPASAANLCPASLSSLAGIILFIFYLSRQCSFTRAAAALVSLTHLHPHCRRRILAEDCGERKSWTMSGNVVVVVVVIPREKKKLETFRNDFSLNRSRFAKFSL